MNTRSSAYTMHAFLLIVAATTRSSAGVAEFTDFGQWQNAVTSFTGIDFTGIPGGTHLTDEYADLGVTFAFDFNLQVVCCDFDSYVDGAGLQAHGPPNGNWIQLTFSAPQHAIAVDFLGIVQFELYQGGSLIFTNAGFGGGGSFFGGLVSTQAFDQAVIRRPSDLSNLVVIDNLYFGVPAPGALGLFALAGLGSLGRRRRG